MILSGLGYPHNSLAKVQLSTQADTVTPITDFVEFSQPVFSSPAIFGQTAVVGANNGSFFAIDIPTMQTLWKFQTDGAVLSSTPAIDDSTVYFSSCDWDRNIYAIDLATGAILWKNDGLGKTGLAKKAAAPNTVRSSELLKLLKYDAQTRAKIISRLSANGIPVPEVFRNAGLAKRGSSAASAAFYGFGDIKSSSVAVDSSNVYVVQREDGYPASLYTIFAFDKYFGDLKWSFSEQRAAKAMWLCSSPLATPKLLFAGWGEGKIYGFDPASGKKVWEDSLSDDIISSPAISGDRLIVAAINGQVVAFKFDVQEGLKSFARSTICYPNPARGAVSHIQVYPDKNGTLEMNIFNENEKPVIYTSGSLSAGTIFLYDWNVQQVRNGVYFALIKVKYTDGTGDRKVLKVAVLH
jgi:hypothetical protein